MSDAWEAVTDIVEGAGDIVEDVAEGVGDVAGDVAEGVGDVVEGVGDVVVDTVEKVGDVVTGIIEDPKKLAAVAIAVAFPGAGTAIGQSLLGPTLAASIGPLATQVIGQTIINTAINGGDLEQGLLTAGVSVMTPALAKDLASTAIESGIDQTVANAGARVAAGTIQAAALGQDPMTALTFGAIDQATSAVLDKALTDSGVRNQYNSLPDAAKIAVNASITSALTGADPSILAANQIVQRAIGAASQEVRKQDAISFAKNQFADIGYDMTEDEINQVFQNVDSREQAKALMDKITSTMPEGYGNVIGEAVASADGSTPGGASGVTKPNWLKLDAGEITTGSLRKDEEGNQYIDVFKPHPTDPEKNLNYTAVYDAVTGKISYEWGKGADPEDPSAGATIVSSGNKPKFVDEQGTGISGEGVGVSGQGTPTQEFDTNEEQIIAFLKSQGVFPSPELVTSIAKDFGVSLTDPASSSIISGTTDPSADLLEKIGSGQGGADAQGTTADTGTSGSTGAGGTEPSGGAPTTGGTGGVGVDSGFGTQISDLEKALEAEKAANEAYKKEQEAKAARQAEQSRLAGMGALMASMSGLTGKPIEDASIPQAKAEFLTSRGGDTKFKGALEEFQQKVEEPSLFSDNSYTQQGNTEMSPYYSYGNEMPVESVLGLGSDQQTNPQESGSLFMAAGGMATPLMAASGGHMTAGTRYGRYAGGGMPSPLMAAGGKMRVDFRKGDAVTGPGDGQSDDIPAMLADGEFVFPADVVAAIGNGSTKAGSDALYDMMHSIRAHVRSAKPKDLPPEIKSPLDFLKTKKRRA